MGIDPVEQRRMMEESLEAIIALWTSDEPITRETDWFTIRDGRLHLRPYTHPHPEIAVAAMVSPSGPRLAGSTASRCCRCRCRSPRASPPSARRWASSRSRPPRPAGPEPDRRTWRVLGTMHIAETREQAIQDCTHGLEDFANYFGGGAGFVPLANTVDGGPQSPRQFVEAYASSGNVVIGTPDDAIEYIEGLLEQSGGFGTFLMLGHDWADREATLRSYQLFAREVIPHFTGQLSAARASHDWATAKRGELFGRAGRGDPERHHHPRGGEGRHVEEKAAASRARRRARPQQGAARRARRRARAGAGLRPGPRGGEGVRHLRLRPPLRQARRRRCSTLGKQMEGMPTLGSRRTSTSTRDVFMGHEFTARGARGRARHPGRGARARSSPRSRCCCR